MAVKIKNSRLDGVRIKYLTEGRKQYLKVMLEHADKLRHDPDKGRRLNKQECVVCYYTAKVGGQAMTETNCGICDKTMLYASTVTNKLCYECASMHDLCQCCGADIKLRVRRNVDLSKEGE